MDSLLKGECTMKCRAEYENELAKTRDQRMKWWRDARYGMFVHYGIYSVYGKHEWAMAEENWDPAEYAKYVDGFQPVEGCCREIALFLQLTLHIIFLFAVSYFSPFLFFTVSITTI